MRNTKPSDSDLVAACLKQDREAQRELYLRYYHYAMSIGIRYAQSEVEAQEIVNDGFLRIFRKLDYYDPEQPFKPWLRTLMVRAAIDHLQRYRRYQQETELSESYDAEGVENSALDLMSYEEILAQVQHLPPAYRLVFNLYAIEGFKHQEIAEQLSISVGTSKSNYAKARRILQQRLGHLYQEKMS